MDGGAWWTAVHGVAKSRTRLSDFTFTFHFHAWEKEMATDSSVLVWRIPGLGEPGGLPSMESHRVGHDWSDLAAAAADLTEQSRILNVLFLRVIKRQLRNTCVCVCVCVCSVSPSCLTLCNSMDCGSPGSSCLWKFSGKNTSVGCHFPSPEDLPDPWNEPTSLRLQHWQEILYH